MQQSRSKASQGLERRGQVVVVLGDRRGGINRIGNQIDRPRMLARAMGDNAKAIQRSRVARRLL